MRFRNEYDFDYFTNSVLYTNFIGCSSSADDSDVRERKAPSMFTVTYGVGSQQNTRNL